MAIVVFIDSSIYLSFYSASNDSLDQLIKISKLIESRAISLIVPLHVEREVRRNRDKKMSDALSEFDKLALKIPPVPRFMSEYDEIKTLRKHLDAAKKARSDAVIRAKEEATRFATRADIIIQEIFNAAGIIDDSERILVRAKRRMLLDEPPGKPASIGDRLNWEHILDYAPSGSDMHIISKDTDFQSQLNEKKPHYSLQLEWEQQKHGRLYVHPELARFLASRFADFDFKDKASVKIEFNYKSENNDLEALRMHVRTLEIKHTAFHSISDAEDEDELLQAFEYIRRNMSYMSDADLLRFVNALLSNDIAIEHKDSDDVKNFISSLIPRIYPLLEKVTVSELESIFDIEIIEPELDAVPDLFTPNYTELEIERLDEIVDHAEEEFEGETDDVDGSSVS